jgi:predicted SnoaL-like aldol condensation-catalyzing enzyme
MSSPYTSPKKRLPNILDQTIGSTIPIQQMAQMETKRIVAEGDLVVIHSHLILKPGNRGSAVVEIFRLENDKIVEHWDVAQEIPETSANNNTMF